MIGQNEYGNGMESRSIWLFASYICSKANFVTDKASRDDIDERDFPLDFRSFDFLTQNLLVPSIDLFATHLSTKCKVFASWYPDPFSSFVDAFTFV